MSEMSNGTWPASNSAHAAAPVVSNISASQRTGTKFVDIYYDGLLAVQNGMASNTPFEKLKEVVAEPKLTITIDLHLGSSDYRVFTTDLTTKYVEFNMGE